MVGFTDDEIRAFLDDPAKQPPCARHLGRELVDFSVDGGWAEVAFQPRAEFANRAGAVQGGFVCAMLDDAMSVAASISRRFAATVPTLQTTVSYLHPTPISRVIARGEVLRFGSSSVVMEGILRTAAGKLLAVATATAIPRPFCLVGAFEDPACTPWANGGTTETSLEARRLHHYRRGSCCSMAAPGKDSPTWNRSDCSRPTTARCWPHTAKPGAGPWPPVAQYRAEGGTKVNPDSGRTAKDPCGDRRGCPRAVGQDRRPARPVSGRRTRSGIVSAAKRRRSVRVVAQSRPRGRTVATNWPQLQLSPVKNCDAFAQVKPGLGP